MKPNKFLDEFFYHSSKVILFIPIIVVILVLVVKFNPKKEGNSDYKNKKIIITPSINPRLTLTPINKENFSFNLKGPLVCRYSFNEASISAYIKNKNVYVEIVKKDNRENFLVNRGCLYMWKDKQYTGEKNCAIGQYINLATSLPFFNPSLIFNIGSLINENESLTTEDSFNQLISSCQKEKINDEIFTVPQAIIFKNNP